MPTTIYVVHTEAETAAAKQLELFLHPQIQKGSLRLDGPFKHDTGEREELTRVGINSADIIVLLVSARLFVECGEAVQLAMVRSRMRLAPVIPVLVSHALLNKGILDGLVTLPRNRMHSYIVEFRSQDEAWVNVAQGILAVVDDLPVRRERFRREREQQVDPSKVQMLFLAANPSDTSRLQLNLEFCRVKGRIESLGLDSRFQITDKWNVEPADLATALLFHRPQVVHISAHGKKENGQDMPGSIMLAGLQIEPTHVTGQGLRQLFQSLPQRPNLLVLNSCFTGCEAATIGGVVDVIIGFLDPVKDKESIQFAEILYANLAKGGTVQEAFDQARGVVRTETRPVLHARPGVDPTKLRILPPKAP